jgi:O-antigen/teichoic acid export membrane protein
MNFFRGFSINLLCTGLTFGIGFANQVIITRSLGKEGRGELTLIATFIMLATLLMGEWLSRGNTYVVGRENQGRAALANTLIYSVVLGLFLLVAAIVCTRLGGVESFEYLGRREIVFPVAGIALAVVAQKAVQAIALGQNRVVLYALMPVLFISTYFVSTLVAIYIYDASLHGVLNAWLVGAAVSLVVTVISTWRWERIELRLDAALFSRVVSIGGRGAISSILIFLLFRSDVYLVKHFLGIEAVGIYGVAVIIAEMMQRVPNLAGSVLLPRVMAADAGSAERLSSSVARNILLFSLAVALLLIVVGEPIISLFGEHFSAAYGPLIWMLPGLVAAGFGSVLNTKLAAEGYPAITIWAPGVALALNVALNLLLIPAMGLVGAAMATSVAYVIWTALVALYYWRAPSPNSG